MDTLFDESVAEINKFYNEWGYQLGWRFLNGSKKTLTNNPAIAFITLNPGGNKIPKDHSWESCENGSSYLYESWRNCPPGKSNLQKQIQLMFEKIISVTDTPIQRNELIERSLTGYFVPFRSPRLTDLEHKKEAFKFAESLWSKIFTQVRPKLFICIDRRTHKHLRSIITNVYGLPLSKEQKLNTGWGNYKADLDEFGDGNQVKMLRLPHLSTFKLFTSSKCTDHLTKIFNQACAHLGSSLES